MGIAFLDKSNAEAIIVSTFRVKSGTTIGNISCSGWPALFKFLLTVQHISIFDAAAKCNGESLNDNLIAGPDILKPLLDV